MCVCACACACAYASASASASASAPAPAPASASESASASVYAGVCLSADISLNCAKNDERILLELCGYVGCHYATNVSNFGYEPIKCSSFKIN